MLIEKTAHSCSIQRLGRQQGQQMLRSTLGNVEIKGYRFVAKPQSFIHKSHEVGHAKQSVGQCIARVKQAYIGVGKVEIVEQYAVIEQHLHIVFLNR